MSDKVVDCRGMVCPQPVICTKKAIETEGAGRITIIVDNEVAKTNVAKFAAASGLSAAVEETDGYFYITVVKGTADQLAVAGAQPAGGGSHPGGQVYLITQNTLGHGSPELGAVLMKALMTTLLEARPLPQSLLFINSGVKLTVEQSPVLESLNMLVEQGVDVLSCGTCLDYYRLTDQLAVGQVTNMYTIVETISQAKTVTL